MEPPPIEEHPQHRLWLEAVKDSPSVTAPAREREEHERAAESARSNDQRRVEGEEQKRSGPVEGREKLGKHVERARWKFGEKGGRKTHRNNVETKKDAKKPPLRKVFDFVDFAEPVEEQHEHEAEAAKSVEGDKEVNKKKEVSPKLLPLKAASKPFLPPSVDVDPVKLSLEAVRRQGTENKVECSLSVQRGRDICR